MHIASCYLALYAPEKHFVYRASSVNSFAEHIEYDKDIGTGRYLNLSNYYEMAEEIVQALRQRPVLLEKYDTLFKDNDEFYYDKSLHLMVFDLMYCCRCYNFYKDITYVPRTKNKKTHGVEQQRKEAELQECQNRIDELENRLQEIDVQLEQYQEISLVGVEVSHMDYGTGVVVSQNGNVIDVRFENKTATYMISKKFKNRPHFEDDDEILEYYTIYQQLKDEKKTLESRLSAECKRKMLI